VAAASLRTVQDIKEPEKDAGEPYGIDGKKDARISRKDLIRGIKLATVLGRPRGMQ